MPRSALDKEEFGFFVNQASMLDDKTWESVIRTRQRIRELKKRVKKVARVPSGNMAAKKANVVTYPETQP